MAIRSSEYWNEFAEQRCVAAQGGGAKMSDSLSTAIGYGITARDNLKNVFGNVAYDPQRKDQAFVIFFEGGAPQEWFDLFVKMYNAAHKGRE